MRTEYQGVTPELNDTIRTVMDSVLVQMNFCLPGKIVKYDSDTQYADVQVQLKRRYEGDDEAKPLPVIPNVPVKHPRAKAGKAYVHMPLKKDDDVTLIFSQRSLDNWKTQGGMQDPADRRKFHLSDAYALIGGSAEPDAFTVNDPDAIEIQNESGRLQLKSDGTINIGDFSPSKSVALGEAVQARLSALESGLSSLNATVTANVASYTAHVHNLIAPLPGSPTGPAIGPESPPSPFNPDTSVVSSQKAKVVP